MASRRRTPGPAYKKGYSDGHLEGEDEGYTKGWNDCKDRLPHPRGGDSFAMREGRKRNPVRRRHRRRNPVNNKQLLYIGGGLAVAGVLWILYQQNQAPPQVLLPSGAPDTNPPAPPSNILALGADAVAFYQQCVVNGGSTTTCATQTATQYAGSAVSGVQSTLSSFGL